jgi:hypothetical protein
MSNSSKSIDNFWRWFAAHKNDFDVLVESSDPFWDEALRHLQQLDSRLWFELSQPDGNDREFIFTAEGHKDAFPLVDAIIAHAPNISGWQFFALKPPMGFDFVTAYEGIRFDPRSMWFLPLEIPSRPNDFGMLVGVPNFSSEIERQANNAIEVILDTALGEREAALDIQHVEVSALPKNPQDAGYIELYELPQYIEWRKRKKLDA